MIQKHNLPKEVNMTSILGAWIETFNCNMQKTHNLIVKKKEKEKIRKSKKTGSQSNANFVSHNLAIKMRL